VTGVLKLPKRTPELSSVSDNGCYTAIVMTSNHEAQLIRRILDAYGVSCAELYERQMGYRNRSFPFRQANGAMSNLILYKSEPHILTKIHNANAVSDYLAVQGFPTRATLSPKIIRLKSATTLKYGAIYSYLPGTTIPWEAYTMKHLKLLGLSMGQMHQSLAYMSLPVALPDVSDEYRAIVGRMQTYFAKDSVIQALRSKLGLEMNRERFEAYPRLLDYAGRHSGRQVLHMDFVRSNLLFGTGPAHLSLGTTTISGILDFEKTAFGLPVFDIARTLAFLLVDCKYKTGANMRKYFLLSGYRKRAGQIIEHSELLEPLVNLFLTYDFYKFLRHNPYESLSQNEHYTRTRDLLGVRGLVRQID
jgi:Ser/Thr protein kinase RdoA (MazF antagonist)